jgi:hypothetical protein
MQQNPPSAISKTVNGSGTNAIFENLCSRPKPHPASNHSHLKNTAIGSKINQTAMKHLEHFFDSDIALLLKGDFLWMILIMLIIG